MNYYKYNDELITIIISFGNIPEEEINQIYFYVVNSIRLICNDNLYSEIHTSVSKLDDNTYIFNGISEKSLFRNEINGNIQVLDNYIDVFCKRMEQSFKKSIKIRNYKYEIEDLLSGEKLLNVIDQTEKLNKQIVECYELDSNASFNNANAKVHTDKFKPLFKVR